MHNIEYFTYDENVNREWVQKELDHYVACEDHVEGCTGLGRNIRWLDNTAVYGDYGLAEQGIKANDRGWYDCLAVKFMEPVKGFTTEKLEQLKAKARDAGDAYRKKNDVLANCLKAEYIGCKACGSKLKREYIHTNYCPLCRSDLRPMSTLKAVEAAKAKWDKANGTVEE